MNRRASIMLINQATKEGWIKQLAFFHLLKFHYNNSCLYDYRSRMADIAKQFAISERTLYRYLNLLKSKGLICDHARNLKLKSIRDFGSHRKKVSLLINADHTLYDISCLLYAKLIEKKARQMAFMESLRRCGGGDRLKDVLCETPFRPSLSLRTIAKLLNVSEYKAFQVTKNLVRLKVITCEKPKPELIASCFSDIKSIEDMPGRRFTIDGNLFEIFGQKIEFLQFPVSLRSFSYQQLKIALKHNTSIRLL